MKKFGFHLLIFCVINKVLKGKKETLNAELTNTFGSRFIIVSAYESITYIIKILKALITNILNIYDPDRTIE